MFDQYDYQQFGTTTAAPKYDKLKAPMPRREELLARNSFGSVNDNKHLNRMFAKDREKRLLKERLAELTKED